MIKKSRGMFVSAKKYNAGKRATVLCLCAAVLMTLSCLLLYFSTRPTVNASEKTIGITVSLKGENTELSIHTEREYLGDALRDEELISGNDTVYGMFVTCVNGYTADDSREEWWCFTRNNQTLFTGVDSTAIANGEHYEITLLTGYDTLQQPTD